MVWLYYKLTAVPPELESAWFEQPLNLKCDILVPKVAFKVNLYSYSMAKISFLDAVLPPLPFGGSGCTFEIVAYATRAGVAQELGAEAWSEERVGAREATGVGVGAGLGPGLGRGGGGGFGGGGGGGTGRVGTSHHVTVQTAHGSVDDRQYVPCNNQSGTREWRPSVRVTRSQPWSSAGTAPRSCSRSSPRAPPSSTSTCSWSGEALSTEGEATRTRSL
jgi:hypothetical protein